MLKWWVQNTRGNRERGVINDKTKVQIALIKLMNTVEPSALCLKSSKDCNPNKNPESHILIQHTKHPKVSGTHSLVPLSSTPHPKKFTVPLPSCLHISNLALLCCAGLQHSWDLAPATWGSSMGQWSNSVCWSGCWRDSCFPISFPSPVLLPPWLHKLFFFITYG